MMRPKALESRLVRRAAQVQARNQQLAANDGWNDLVLLLTHGRQISRAAAGRATRFPQSPPFMRDGRCGVRLK